MMDQQNDRNTTAITREKAKEMVNIFRKNTNKHPDAKTLTKSVWFSLEQLDNFIARIKSDGEKHYGVRMYFATNPENTVHSNINGNEVDDAYLNTLVLVATKRIEELSPDGKTIKINLDYFGNVNAEDNLLDPENKGELCPEECGGTDQW